MNIALVLLARIGSKRIPKKPLVKLGGKYLIEWTLNIMRQLPYPSYIFSDSEQVKDIVREYKLNARDKILENKEGKHYTSEELKEYNKEMNADIIVLFQSTSPFKNLELINQWILEFPLYNVNCAFTVYPVIGIFYTEDGKRIWPIYRGYENNKRLYKETGSIYIFEKEQIEKDHITLGTKKLLIDPYDFDIDTYEDLKEAELFLKEEEKYNRVNRKENENTFDS